MRDGVATPLFGSSALLGPMGGADGWFCVPEPDTGWPPAPRSRSGSTGDAAAPFLRDVPAAEALAAWLDGVRSRRPPARVERSAAALGRVTAAPVWALRSSPAYDAAAMDGIAVRAADTLGATETSPRERAGASRSSTPATRCPTASTRS